MQMREQFQRDVDRIRDDIVSAFGPPEPAAIVGGEPVRNRHERRRAASPKWKRLTMVQRVNREHQSEKEKSR